MSFLSQYIVYVLIFYCFLSVIGVYQPKVEIKGSDTFNAEETVHITCIVSIGNFTRWLDKNGQTLSSSLDPRVSVVIRREGDFNEVATLSITNATTSDSGLYTCKGKAIDGSKLNETKLITVKGNDNKYMNMEFIIFKLYLLVKSYFDHTQFCKMVQKYTTVIVHVSVQARCVLKLNHQISNLSQRWGLLLLY